MGLFEFQGGYDDLIYVGVLTSGRIEAVTYDNVNFFRTAETTVSVTAGTWASAAAVFTSSSSRSVFLNGANKVTSTTASAVNFSQLSRFYVGAYGLDNPLYHIFDGQIMNPTVWSVALTDEEILSLHEGIVPTRVRPASLVAHWTVDGRTNPEIDIINRYELTLNNFSSTIDDGPRIFRQTIGA